MIRRRYRRPLSLVCYLNGDHFILHNYITGMRVAADATILPVLHAASDWRSSRDVAAAMPAADPAVVRGAIDELVRLSLLESSHPKNAGREAAVAAWARWMPEAALFHFGVRDVPFTDAAIAESALSVKARSTPPPPATKTYRGVRHLALPPARRDGELVRHLLGRRTWRRFRGSAITKEQLATLLGLTWGVQAWVGPRSGRTLAAFKTAPSGGARHSIEAYVVARRVAGVRPGLYHYAPDHHRLDILSTGRLRAITSYIPRQTWFSNASALVFMTSVFERSRWRYGYPRAYRSIMFEAGHHCQTFLLLATWLGLAPFCTGALADSIVERDLGIDGVRESVIYACGVGVRPPGVDWAPSPHETRLLKKFPPASAKRPRRR